MKKDVKENDYHPDRKMTAEECKKEWVKRHRATGISMHNQEEELKNILYTPEGVLTKNEETEAQS